MIVKMIFKQKKYFCILLVSFFLFIIAAAPGSDGNPPEFEKWKFAVISDTQGDARGMKTKSCINDEVVGAIAEDIVREKPDFLLVSGDLVNGWFKNYGTAYNIQYADWKKAMHAVYEAGIKVYPVRGNHDDGPERLALPPLPANLEPPADSSLQIKKAFREAFNQPYIPQNGPAEEKGLTYSFVYKNAFIIGMDQYTGGQHKVNQEWLNRQLAENKSRYIFVYGHEPAFGVIHEDNLSYYVKDRDIFWDSLGKAGAKIYFCGHDHIYSRAMISDSAGNPVRQIINSSAGGSLRKWDGKYKEENRVKGEYYNCDYHGYIVVTVDAPKVTIVWKALVKTGTEKSWQILDEFSVQ